MDYIRKLTPLKFLTSLLFLICSLSVSAQNQEQQRFLVEYGQYWGFLKYFHPTPSGQNWDDVLLDDFEKVKSASSRDEFNIIVNSLFDKCETPNYQKRNLIDSLRFAESFEWINSANPPEAVGKEIQRLIEEKPKFNNKYIANNPVGNLRISNEKDYEYEVNSAIQYLALTRYWNVINYFCPNRDLVRMDWTEAYHKHLMRFIQASSYEDYYFAVRMITAEIADGHGFIRTKNDILNNQRLAPFYCLKVKEGYFITLVWQDSLNSLNIQRLDRIVSIDGKSAEDRIKEIGTYISSSNDYFLSHMTHYMRLSDKDSMDITVERDGKLISQRIATIDREELKKRYKPGNYMPPPAFAIKTDSVSGKKYAYMHLGRLKRKDINGKFKRALKKTDYAVIDVRNYPNWTLPKLCEVLIEGRQKFARFVKMDSELPGSYTWTKSQTIGNKRKGYDGKVIILVDHHTMSQAEYTVMALQRHPNAVTIGGQTAGADGNISTIPLPFGINSIFSGLGVYYLDGTNAQQVGVKRDHHVVQEITYFTDRKDLIYEKALELIRESK